MRRDRKIIGEGKKNFILLERGEKKGESTRGSETAREKGR